MVEQEQTRGHGQVEEGGVSGDPSSDDRAFTERAAPHPMTSTAGEGTDGPVTSGDVDLEDPDRELRTPTEESVGEAAREAGERVAAAADAGWGSSGDPVGDGGGTQGRDGGGTHHDRHDTHGDRDAPVGDEYDLMAPPEGSGPTPPA
ncbi:MAG: hypothetical protein MUF35_01460 [Candidatus Nanopelagicales bacterium]|nr:hypothetical protein [Candidatus Nanopelagicales bacterium]